jgi:hypothetical protein
MRTALQASESEDEGKGEGKSAGQGKSGRAEDCGMFPKA